VARRPRRRAERSSAATGDERTSFEEAFRVLRSNLSVSLADITSPTVVVTSANPNEGKTLTCCSLAASFADAGQRVVLVDLDLRHPNAHSLIGAHNEYGATDVLLGRRSLESCLQYVELAGPPGAARRGLYFLATGSPVANPTELIGTNRTARLLDGLAAQADLVLLDTPPVLPVADTLVIGRMAAGAVLVTEARKTEIGALQKAKDLLIRNQTRLLGIVLNKFEQRDAPYGYGYGYGYGSTPVDDVAVESDPGTDEPAVATDGGDDTGPGHRAVAASAPSPPSTNGRGRARS
jgi:capsular exopolysaccharide synthesis family protein